MSVFHWKKQQLSIYKNNAFLKVCFSSDKVPLFHFLFHVTLQKLKALQMQFHTVFNSSLIYSHWWQSIKPIKSPSCADFPSLTWYCSAVEMEVSWCWCCSLVDRFVEQLSTEESALELLPQQAALSLRSLHEAAVLLRSARQVRDDLVHRAVRHILVHWESRLTCSQKHTHVMNQDICSFPRCSALHSPNGKLIWSHIPSSCPK